MKNFNVTSRNIRKLFDEILKELEKRANNKLAEREKIYFKKDGYKTYGIKTPEVRKLISEYKKVFAKLTTQEKLELAKLFYKSNYGGQDTFATALLQMSLSDFIPADFDYLDEVLGYFRSWGTTDDFCMNVLQPLLQKYPKQTLSLCKKWNNSNNIWKKRASVVVFVRKIGESGKFTSQVLEFCDNLIWDKEDLVQKAVGWALKDNIRGNKEKVINYVKTLRSKGVPNIITLYAVRDLKGSDKENILNVKRTLL